MQLVSRLRPAQHPARGCRDHEATEKRRAIIEQVIALPDPPGLLYVPPGRRPRSTPRRSRGGRGGAAYHAGLARRARAGARRVPRLRPRHRRRDLGLRHGHRQAHVRFVRARRAPSRWTPTTSRSAAPAATASRPRPSCYFRTEDLRLRAFFSSGTADETLLAVVAVLRRGGRPGRADDLAEEPGVTRARLTARLNLLQQAGAVITDDTTASAGPTASAADVGRARRRGRRRRASSVDRRGSR